MWNNNLNIENPFGVSVFGSALIKTSPDLVTIHATVARIDEKPASAFAQARKSARTASDFLRKAGIDEFGMSRVTLAAEYRFMANERRFVGYKARIGLKLILRALDRTEDILSGLVEAGANEIGAIDFQTSTLKEIRAKARKEAIEAAREKAQIYAVAAGVALGRVLHIQDVNPQILQGRGEGHVRQEPVVDNEPEKQTLDPGAIEVGAAVLMAFSLLPSNS